MKKTLTLSKTLKKIISLFIKYRGKKTFIIILISSALLSMFLFIEPLIINEVLKQIEDFYNTGILEISSIFPIIGILFLYALLSILFSFTYNYYLVDKNILKVHIETSVSYMKKIVNMNYGTYLDKKPGTIFKDYDRGLDGQLMFFFSFFIDFIRMFFALITVMIIIFMINWKLALASISMLPIVVFIGFYVNYTTIKKQNALHKKWSKAFGHISESLTNLAIVKTLRLEKLFKNKFKNDLELVLEDQFKVSKNWQLANVYSYGTTSLSRTIVLLTGVILIQSGEIGLSTLFIFIMYTNFVYWPINSFFSQLKRYQDNLTKAKIFFEEFDELELDEDNKNSKELEDINGKIEFKDINFSYTKDKKTLNNINFTVKPGEKIALVGDTGSGKTTITNLLIRFWEANSGEILIDGKNISQIKKSSLRKNIGLVMQDNTLFNETIRENLSYARDNIAEEEIITALKNAEADFVFNLKDGLDTIIGERGLKLSGGEKQRISIARIFLKNPQILVLDEATSALDNKTEVKIKKSLDNLMKGKTSIIVAHRLSTIQNADKILVLKDGEIVESGKYDELINKKGNFYKIANPDNLMVMG